MKLMKNAVHSSSFPYAHNFSARLLLRLHISQVGRFFHIFFYLPFWVQIIVSAPMFDSLNPHPLLLGFPEFKLRKLNYIFVQDLLRPGHPGSF